MFPRTNRDIIINCRVSQEEAEVIDARFRQSHSPNKADFMRRMCMQGAIVSFDNAAFTDVKKSIAGVANNVNQVARNVNATGAVHADDISDIQFAVSEIQKKISSLEHLLRGALRGSD